MAWQETLAWNNKASSIAVMGLQDCRMLVSYRLDTTALKIDGNIRGFHLRKSFFLVGRSVTTQESPPTSLDCFLATANKIRKKDKYIRY